MYTFPMNNQTLRGPRPLLLAIAATLLLVNVANAQLYRPERARRTIKAGPYELVIQKNSQIDLLTPEGQPLLDNAFPSLILEGGEEVPLKIDYRNTNRYSVDNPIGKGNGFHYASAECEWRIATYPSENFLTFDLTYTNNSKKPVAVAGLSPLGVGRKEKGGIYPGGKLSQVLILEAPSAGQPFVRIGHEAGESPGHIAAWSPASGRSLVAGFLTHRLSLGKIELGHSAPIGDLSFYIFSSVCVFSSPVVVEPGGRLNAETLFFSMGQENPTRSLETFVRASQALEPFPSRAQLHGWLPVSATESNAASLLDQVTAARPMIPLGWTNLNLGSHWSVSPGSADADHSRFPQGLSEVTVAAHAADLSVSLGMEQRITDPSIIETALNKLKTTGVDTIALIPTPGIGTFDIPAPHPLTVLQTIHTSTMDLPKVVYTHPVAQGPFTLKHWALDSRSYYLPSVGNPLLAPGKRELAQDTTHFNDTQFIAACTLAAIQGKPLRPTLPWTQLSPLRQRVLACLLPAPAHAGHPLDLFQEGPPQRWALPLRTKAGEWAIAAMFNWEPGAGVELNTPLTDLGLNNDNLYTVYDFWAGQYLGLIEKTLRVEVPPESVRLLGLRRYERRPMLVASSRHYTQGASDHTALDWAHETRTLTGTFAAVPGQPCTLSILVPEPYTVGQCSSTAEIVGQKQTGSLLELTIRALAGGEVQWKVTF